MKLFLDNKDLLEIKEKLNINFIEHIEFTPKTIEKYNLEYKTLYNAKENKDIDIICMFFKKNKNRKKRILFLIEIIKKYTIEQAKAKLENLKKQEKLIMFIDKNWTHNIEYLIISRQITLLKKYINNQPFPYTKLSNTKKIKTNRKKRKKKKKNSKTLKMENLQFINGDPNKMKFFNNIFGSGSILYIKHK